jgi:hypothetical protein
VAVTGLGEETNDASYSAWLLVVGPKHMPLEWSSICEGV